MNGAEMKTAFEEIVDDKMPTDTLFYQFANLEKNLVEMDRPWEILLEYNGSNTIAGSHIYTTAISLPSRYLNTAALFVGDDRLPYKQIPFQLRDRFQDMTHRYYLKRKDSTFFICGRPASGQTVKHYYVEESADIAAGTTWVFPSWGHMLIPIRVAKKFYAVDRGEKARSWDDRWNKYEDEIHSALVSWNHRLIKDAIRNGEIPVDFSSFPNVVG